MQGFYPFATTTLSLMIMWGAGTLPSTVLADQALAQKSGCLACHSMEKKIVGPSFKAVAAKYKGDDKALTFLIEKVMQGGSGIWGIIPMPPNTALSKEDATTLVRWILKQ